MDGFKSHAIDVEAQIELLDHEPDVVLLNETKLDEGDPDPTLTGYVLICRRDRKSEKAEASPCSQRKKNSPRNLTQHRS